MILYINKRLNDWARWKLGGRGSSKSPYPAYNIPHKPDVDDAPPRGDYVPINDLECCATDKCVVALNPALQKAVTEFYCRTGTTPAQKARYCGCSERTLYYRIDESHRQILGYLNDLSCGIPVPAYTLPAVKRKLHEAIDAVAENMYISGMLV